LNGTKNDTRARVILRASATENDRSDESFRAFNAQPVFDHELDVDQIKRELFEVRQNT